MAVARASRYDVIRDMRVVLDTDVLVSGLRSTIGASVRDPDDELFVELAISGGADALVTFNLADYRPARLGAPRLPIPVCRPGDILRRLTWRPSATSRSAFLPP
jgi:hypothetical protein